MQETEVQSRNKANFFLLFKEQNKNKTKKQQKQGNRVRSLVMHLN
jgi:hypothetical protein